MYKELRGERTSEPWSHILIDNYARPRSQFILWLALMGRLSTNDRLYRFGIITDEKYPFCDQKESLDHLLFDCNTTGRIWEDVLVWVGYRRQAKPWQEDQAWILQEVKKKGWRRRVLKMGLEETVYEV
ncbi:unnamed protein product [Lathyrus sativus]|nr:unnamed protein product [Lathyrus sativus]